MGKRRGKQSGGRSVERGVDTNEGLPLSFTTAFFSTHLHNDTQSLQQRAKLLSCQVGQRLLPAHTGIVTRNVSKGPYTSALGGVTNSIPRPRDTLICFQQSNSTKNILFLGLQVYCI